MSSTSSVGNKIKVMIVDDSSVVRGFISKALQSQPDIEIAATAVNGLMAVNLLKRSGTDRLNIDVIILDIEMPEMDGLTAIPLLLEASPESKIIMVSTLTQRNAEISLKAISLGAADYIPKPSTNKDIVSSTDFNEELVRKVRELGSVKKYTGKRNAGSALKEPDINLRKEHLPDKINVLAIGSSTGGPQALIKFFSDIKGLANNIPIFITQHMPPVFTTYLAKQIGQVSGKPCNEAVEGQKVIPGHIYIAPGDYHMVVQKNGGEAVTMITKGPPENFCRPAVDPLFRSISEIYGGNVLAIILTGMGQDGLEGARTIVKKGGALIAQDEKTSVVWGMPGSVAKNGLCNAVLPLEDIGPYFKEISKGRII